jgi:hypothetical protein
MAFIALAMTTGNAESQNVRRERQQKSHNREVVAVRKWHHRGHKVVIFHPVWGPRLAYHHRWVYFPRYNFYWDNVRRVYVYRSNNVWIVNETVPACAIKVDLNAEQKVELPDQADDNDSIQDQNSEHVSLYKAQQQQQ